MPLVATRGAASAQGFGEFAQSAAPVYIEDVFSTWLYTGNDTTQTITNGLDLAGKGGLVWTKRRSGAIANHILFDTSRGALSGLFSDATNAATSLANTLTSFNNNGFTLGSDSSVNGNPNAFASWTFREQPKFFDVVTYTGNGTTNDVAHALGSVPGFVVIKKTSTTSNWYTLNRDSSGNYVQGYLNTTGSLPQVWTSANTSNYLTSTTLKISALATITGEDMNASGTTYVAYLFAHNAGGFGLTGTDNVISCGSFTTDGSGNATVNLGYEPQWVMTKASSTASNWFMNDNMRGMSVIDSQMLRANSSAAEDTFSPAWVAPNATGFNLGGGSASQTYIYIAIRRGPMRTPTSGTSVFQPVTYTGNNTDNRFVSTGIVTDGLIARLRNNLADTIFSDRLRANGMNFTNLADDEKTYADGLDQELVSGVQYGTAFSSMSGFYVGNSASTLLNQSSTPQLAYAFRRAPGFFDVVCYTGTGSARTVAHNLAAVPELMIVKTRSVLSNWAVYAAAAGNTNYGILNSSNDFTSGSTFWNNTTPTASVFTVGSNSSTNSSNVSYVAYLAATVSGVSRVGTYTGTGSDVSVNCGFTSGARFVMIKAISNSFGNGSWYVWDSARGITSGNDPYLLLNDSSSEVTNTNYVDAASNGFIVKSGSPAALNESGRTYLFWAIA